MSHTEPCPGRARPGLRVAHKSNGFGVLLKPRLEPDCMCFDISRQRLRRAWIVREPLVQGPGAGLASSIVE